MDITTSQAAGGWTVINVAGAVDSTSAPELEKVCRSSVEAGVHRLAIDLADVFYMSSAGLRVLLATLKLLAKRDGQMALVGPRVNVKQVLDMSGLGRIFSIVADVQQLQAQQLP